MYEYRANILRCVDGDTVEARIDLGFGVSCVQTLRLFGINAPEPHGLTRAEGNAATHKLESLIEQYTPIVVETHKDKRGSFGRYLAELWGTNGSVRVNLNQLMVTEGHAVAATY